MFWSVNIGDVLVLLFLVWLLVRISRVESLVTNDLPNDLAHLKTESNNTSEALANTSEALDKILRQLAADREAYRQWYARVDELVKKPLDMYLLNIDERLTRIEEKLG